MIVIAGLVILAAAVIAGTAGVLANGRAAKASLAQSRRETAAVSQQRDDLISQRDTACAYTVLDEQRNYTASTLGDGDGGPRAGALTHTRRAARTQVGRRGPDRHHHT
jgi:hypothetical protein